MAQNIYSKASNALIETDTAGQYGFVVTNPDGSNIGGTTGGATEVTLDAISDKIAASSIFFANSVVNGTIDNTAQSGAIATFLMGYDTASETFQALTCNTDGGQGNVLNVNIVPNEFVPCELSLQKDEDAAHTTGDPGIQFLAVRNDSNTTRTSTDGDYSPISVDPAGNVRVVGNIAHDSADSGDPIKIGGYAKATAPTAVSADGDRVNAWFDLNGRLQIGDGGGSLTVDGSITANQNNKTTSVVSSVSNSASSFTVLSSNSSAVGRTIYNDSANDVYIKFGTTASTSGFTVKISSYSFFELSQPLYNGRIDAIASAATGSLRVTEW